MLSYALYNQCVTQLSAAHEAANGVGSAKAIPWATIIQAILSLLGGGGCLPKPAKAADVQAAIAGDAHGYVEAVVRRQLRQEYGLRAWVNYNGPAVVATIKSVPIDDALVGQLQLAANTDE